MANAQLNNQLILAQRNQKNHRNDIENKVNMKMVSDQLNQYDIRDRRRQDFLRKIGTLNERITEQDKKGLI